MPRAMASNSDNRTLVPIKTTMPMCSPHLYSELLRIRNSDKQKKRFFLGNFSRKKEAEGKKAWIQLHTGNCCCAVVVVLYRFRILCQTCLHLFRRNHVEESARVKWKCQKSRKKYWFVHGYFHDVHQTTGSLRHSLTTAVHL